MKSTKRSSQDESSGLSHDRTVVKDSPGHVHGPDCGHEAVQHAGHTDYLVDGRLHHPHGNHCHDHGARDSVD